MMTSDHRATIIRLPDEPGSYWAYFFPADAKSHGQEPPDGYNAVVVISGKAPYLQTRVWVLGWGRTYEPRHGDTLISGPRIAVPEMPEDQRRVSSVIPHDPQ
jgi:hypothetical protein